MKEKSEPQLKVLESKHNIALDYDQELKQLWVELLRHTDSVVLSKGETHAFSEQNHSVLTPRRGR